jgi:hypothetical protein
MLPRILFSSLFFSATLWAAGPQIILPALEGDRPATLKKTEIHFTPARENAPAVMLIQLNFHRDYLDGKLPASNPLLNYTLLIHMADPFPPPATAAQGNPESEKSQKTELSANQTALANYLKYSFHGPLFHSILIGGSNNDLLKKDPKKVDFYYPRRPGETYSAIEDLPTLVAKFVQKIESIDKTLGPKRTEEIKQFQQERGQQQKLKIKWEQTKEAYQATKDAMGADSVPAQNLSQTLMELEKEMERQKPQQDQKPALDAAQEQKIKEIKDFLEQISDYVKKNNL